MYYVDSQRTLTRRESSLVTPKRYGYDDVTDDTMHTYRGQSTVRLTSISGVSIATRKKGSVQNELVTVLFESMLDNIIASWTPLEDSKKDENTQQYEASSKSNDAKDAKRKKTDKPASSGGIGKAAKAKRSRSGQDFEIPQSPSLTQSIQQSWWSSPDERAIIRFINGNVYEGSISMRCMHGNGRFQWADGTVYLGQFKENVIIGEGTIQWKNDTWYEGEFVNNLRHGHGLYVDSRQQRCYSGQWFCGAKHGQGLIHYGSTFKNSYDGQWERNVKQGCGVREYCKLSGYKGEWYRDIREGEGLMIWPNHDVYKGGWDNGVMSGSGIYVWETYYNSTLSIPLLNAYRGFWKHGQRHGHGVLDFGLDGAMYKGEFMNNKKHGVGRIVTNNGFIIQDKELFLDDNFRPLATENENIFFNKKQAIFIEPMAFNMCDDSVGLIYHIEQALHDIDDVKEARAIIISDYFENNRITADISELHLKGEYKSKINNIIEFEEVSLRKAIECYRKQLLNIYHIYATICNTEPIPFNPVLIRLFLWQLYFDSNVIEKGLTLVEIDKMFHDNPLWLSRNPHDPFEKIFYWQFIHSLITVARKIYADKCLPSTKPDTILAKAFRTFMDNDVLPNVGLGRGKLAKTYGEIMPLKAMYKLYRDLGEPHTIRTFLRNVRYPAHWCDMVPPTIADEEELPCGRNMYVLGDGLNYIACGDNNPTLNLNDSNKEDTTLRLFNFGNLTTKSILKNMFSKIFPQIYVGDKLVNLDINMTFFEFLEAFVSCAEESIRVKEEEERWTEQFLTENEAPLSSPIRSNKGK